MNKDFADYCCELLASAGPCAAKRMFGGWGISVDGLSIAIIADLGGGEKLWLKSSDDTRAQYVAAGSARFTYSSTKNGVTRDMGMNYYSAPEEAMDSPDAMVPWARLALGCATSALALRLARRASKKDSSKKIPAKAPTKPKAKPASKAQATKQAVK